jgi:hypothetical protein
MKPQRQRTREKPRKAQTELTPYFNFRHKTVLDLACYYIKAGGEWENSAFGSLIDQTRLDYTPTRQWQSNVS